MKAVSSGALCLAVCFGIVNPAGAQAPVHRHDNETSSVVRDFVERAREATARYHDRNAAIADGYRRLGPDFPGMGEHWINPSLMVEGRFEATRPQVLSYAEIGGRPTLIGVAYAVPLGPGESPPGFLPGAHAWHDHTGTIDEESVLLHQTVSGHGEPSGTRLAMLHTWIWLPNPDGLFRSDNWALPFARLGLEAPVDAPPAAAKALSLAAGGGTYYHTLFRLLAEPDPAEDAAAREIIDRFRVRVEEWLMAHPQSNGVFQSSDLAELAEQWEELWTEVASAARAEIAARLQPLLSLPHAHRKEFR